MMDEHGVYKFNSQTFPTRDRFIELLENLSTGDEIVKIVDVGENGKLLHKGNVWKYVLDNYSEEDERERNSFEYRDIVNLAAEFDEKKVKYIVCYPDLNIDKTLLNHADEYIALHISLHFAVQITHCLTIM